MTPARPRRRRRDPAKTLAMYLLYMFLIFLAIVMAGTQGLEALAR